MSNEIDLVAYGQMKAKVDQLVTDVHKLTGLVEEMSNMMQQARGGWRVLAMVSGASSLAGAAMVWVASHVRIG